jgi:myosin-1
VRCIKPNELKSPDAFDHDKIKNQVFYLGLLENVRVRRAGFAHRLTYQKFLHRYKCLSKKTWPNPSRGSVKENVSLLLREHNCEGDVRYGLTKLFIKSPQTVFAFETMRNDKMPHIVNFLQKHWRGTLARRHYKRLKAASLIAVQYKRYKSRQYIRNLVGVYGGAKGRPDFGKRLMWPACGGSFFQASIFLWRSYFFWDGSKNALHKNAREHFFKFENLF